MESNDPTSNLTPRDYLYVLNLDFDIEAQLAAIAGLLQRNRRADKALKDEIEQIEQHAGRHEGIRAELALDDWLDRIHYSTYQDAAHSMSAVGMLAPLIE